MTALLLFAVGLAVGGFAWVGLVWIPRQLAPIDAIHALAASRRARVRGDGRREPLVVLGSVAGRAFTLTWQQGGEGDVLLLAIDCVGEAAPSSAEGGERAAGDAALVTRWVRPSADVFARLDTILEEQARLAAELEERGPTVDEQE